MTNKEIEELSRNREQHYRMTGCTSCGPLLDDVKRLCGLTRDLTAALENRNQALAAAFAAKDAEIERLNKSLICEGGACGHYIEAEQLERQNAELRENLEGWKRAARIARELAEIG